MTRKNDFNPSPLPKNPSPSWTLSRSLICMCCSSGGFGIFLPNHLIKSRGCPSIVSFLSPPFWAVLGGSALDSTSLVSLPREMQTWHPTPETRHRNTHGITVSMAGNSAQPTSSTNQAEQPKQVMASQPTPPRKVYTPPRNSRPYDQSLWKPLLSP